MYASKSPLRRRVLTIAGGERSTKDSPERYILVLNPTYEPHANTCLKQENVCRTFEVLHKT